jgi:uncharacterized protein YukE
MSQMIGADPEQLDTLGTRLASSADRLDTIRGEIGALLSHSHWEGADADDFRGMWHHRLSGQLQAAAHASRDCAATLRTNATQQRDASSTDGGSEGGGIWATLPEGALALAERLRIPVTVIHGALLALDTLKWLAMNVKAEKFGEVSERQYSARVPGWLVSQSRSPPEWISLENCLVGGASASAGSN